MKRKKFRITSLLCALVMIFSTFGGLTAYAAETDNNENIVTQESVTEVRDVDGVKVTIQGLEEGDNVDEILEMASDKIQASDGDVTIMPMVAHGKGKSYVGGFTFYDENWGSYHTMNGNKMSYIIAYKKADNLDYSIDMYVACYQYGGQMMDYMYMYAGGGSYSDSDGYRYYTSREFNINYGVDYRFYYSCCTSGGSADDPVRTVAVKVWVVLA